eukprot:402111_1
MLNDCAVRKASRESAQTKPTNNENHNDKTQRMICFILSLSIAIFVFTTYIYSAYYVISVVFVSYFYITMHQELDQESSKRESCHDFYVLAFLLLLALASRVTLHNIFILYDRTCTTYTRIVSYLFNIFLLALAGDIFVYFRYSVIVALRRRLTYKHLGYMKQSTPTPFTILRKLKILYFHSAHTCAAKYAHAGHQCSICLDDFTTKDKETKGIMQVLKCGHLFHRECILKSEQAQWKTDCDEYVASIASSYSKCPNCRGSYHLLYQKHNYDIHCDKDIHCQMYGLDEERDMEVLVSLVFLYTSACVNASNNNGSLYQYLTICLYLEIYRISRMLIRAIAVWFSFDYCTGLFIRFSMFMILT